MSFVVPGSPAFSRTIVQNPSNSTVGAATPTQGVSGNVFATVGTFVAPHVANYVNQVGGAAWDRATEASTNFVRDFGKGGRGNGNKSSTALRASKGNGGGSGSGGGNNGGRSGSSNGGDSFQGPFPGTIEGANAPIEWNSPVFSGTIVNPSQEYTKDYTPMFISCGQFFPDTANDLFKESFYSQIVNGDLFYDYLRAAENNINRELSDKFLKSDFVHYLHVTLRALQVYFCIDSILVYVQDPTNYNIAMDSLRNRITPRTISAHLRIKEKLEREIMNPNAVEFIRFMYQNFSLGRQKGSPIIKLSYGEMLANDLSTGDYLENASAHEQIIGEMNDLKYTKMSSYIRRSFPDWKITLNPSTYEVLYSEQFLNFWHNQLTSAQQLVTDEIMFSKSVDNDYSDMYYGIEGEEVDGMIYACSSVVRNGNDGSKFIQTGLWAPITSFSDNNASYRTNVKYFAAKSFIGTFTLTQRVASMIFGCFHYVYGDPGALEAFDYGYGNKRVIQVHTLHNTKQAISESVRYLFKPDKLPEVRKFVQRK